MKRLILSISFISVLTAAIAQKDTRVVIGTIDSIHSSILNETRKIWVYVPNQNNSIYSAQHYPVVYLLDGDAHFHSVTGLIQQLTSVNGNSICPEMIVVGIPNTNRTRDLTPTHSLAAPDGKEQPFFSASGGGEAFTTFLEKELIPYIDSHYSTAPHRMLVGHSFGGLFVINTLVHHPGMFNSYVSIDPSMWWDHRKLLMQTSSVLQQNKLKGKALFVGVANTMPAGMDTTQMLKDTTGGTSHIRSIFQLVKMIKGAPGSGLRFDWKYYPGDDHGSVPLISEYDALHFIFDFYKTSRQNSTTPESLSKRYNMISDKIGYPILPPESIVNNSGYGALQQNKLDEAYAYFKMNVDNYPKSANAYDSMGDYFAAKKDKTKAIEYFRKALGLKEMTETREKLEKLQQGK